MNIKQQNNSKYRINLIKNPTKAELIFIDKLKQKNIRFLFQKGFYKGDLHCIVDFYLPNPIKTCIEIDGGYHDSIEQKRKDLSKDRYLIERGFKVVRIKNDDVLNFDVSTLE